MIDSEKLLDVVVAGAGLSGLATAEAIARLAPEVRLLCLDARERVGGNIRTIRENGFLIEAGPAGFIDKLGAVRRLAANLGIDGELVCSSAARRGRWLLAKGRLRRFPVSIGAFLTTDLLSVRGKLRMMLEPFQPARNCEETVAAFATRRLGAEAAEVLIDPIVSGIYAADSGQISLKASLPHLAALEDKKRSLLLAFVLASGTPRQLVSFRDGCGQLVGALQERLSTAIQCDAPVESISRTSFGYAVRVGGARPRIIRCRAFVSAAPSLAASRYFRELDPETSWLLAQVRYASVVVVAMGFRRDDIPHPLNGFGYLVARSEQTPVLGVQWSSSIYPGLRAPQDGCLLRLFLGGARHPTLERESEADLIAIATAQLRRTLGVVAEPIVCRVECHHEAMPQYLLDHNRRVADIERRLRELPGVFVGGNGLRGLGMDSLVHDADIQAEAAVDFVRSASQRSWKQASAWSVR